MKARNVRLAGLLLLPINAFTIGSLVSPIRSGDWILTAVTALIAFGVLFATYRVATIHVSVSGAGVVVRNMWRTTFVPPEEFGIVELEGRVAVFRTRDGDLVKIDALGGGVFPGLALDSRSKLAGELNEAMASPAPRE